MCTECVVELAVLESAIWTQCSAELQPSRSIIVWGQTSLEKNHLEILPSVDRQNAKLAAQFPIGYG